MCIRDSPQAVHRVPGEQGTQLLQGQGPGLVLGTVAFLGQQLQGLGGQATVHGSAFPAVAQAQGAALGIVEIRMALGVDLQAQQGGCLLYTSRCV